MDGCISNTMSETANRKSSVSKSTNSTSGSGIAMYIYTADWISIRSTTILVCHEVHATAEQGSALIISKVHTPRARYPKIEYSELRKY